MLRTVPVPSLRPYQHFDAYGDAQAIKNALATKKESKGFLGGLIGGGGGGCDEKAIINILCRRNSEQRQQIAFVYKKQFGEDLGKEFSKAMSGNMEELSLALLEKGDVYDASQLYKATKGLGTDEDCLIEIMSSRDNDEMRAIKTAYQQMYHQDLEADLVGDTSGEFQRLLTTLCAGTRNESPRVDEYHAVNTARQLHDAVSRNDNPGALVSDILTSNFSFPQMNRIFQEYRKLSGKDIEDVIDKEYFLPHQKDDHDSLTAVAQVAKGKIGFFANCLNKYITKNNDKGLIRMAVSRSEKDLKTVNQEYQRQYANSIFGHETGTFHDALAMLTNG